MGSSHVLPSLARENVQASTSNTRANRPAPNERPHDTGPAPRAAPSGSGLASGASPLASPRVLRTVLPPDGPCPPSLGDAWVDEIADEVAALLAERGLDLELLVMYDKVTEVLHAVGFSGAPARYFRSLASDRAEAPPDEGLAGAPAPESRRPVPLPTMAR